MSLSRRRFFTFLAGAAAAVGVPSAWFARKSFYAGPVSDHFDGVRFFDPEGAQLKSPVHLLKWQLTPNKPKWPNRAPSPLPQDQPPERVDGSKVRFAFVGHASWLIQTAGLNILVDPVWSERASPVSFAGPKRVNDPGIAFDRLPPIDAVLVSHAHYDHLDMPTLSRLAEKLNPRVIAPLGNDVVMTGNDPAVRASGHDWGEHVVIGNGVAVTLVRTRHWSARGAFDRNKTLWASFVLETPAGKIYIVCDSGYGTGKIFREVREAHGPFIAAILPIGAYEPRWFLKDQHMSPSDAVQALQDCGADRAFAHHFGTFKLTDELIDQPISDLHAALDEKSIARERFQAPKPGQVFEV